jgi:hypothetical protein
MQQHAGCEIDFCGLNESLYEAECSSREKNTGGLFSAAVLMRRLKQCRAVDHPMDRLADGLNGLIFVSRLTPTATTGKAVI